MRNHRTGPPAVLQAAHLRGFAKYETHDLDEGLLLRTDLHQLFDAGLMAIDPATRSVTLAPSLDGYPDYQKLRGLVIDEGPYLPGSRRPLPLRHRGLVMQQALRLGITRMMLMTNTVPGVCAGGLVAAWRA